MWTRIVCKCACLCKSVTVHSSVYLEMSVCACVCVCRSLSAPASCVRARGETLTTSVILLTKWWQKISHGALMTAGICQQALSPWRWGGATGAAVVGGWVSDRPWTCSHEHQRKEERAYICQGEWGRQRGGEKGCLSAAFIRRNQNELSLQFPGCLAV